MKKAIALQLTKVHKKYIVHHEKPTLAERVLHGENQEFSALKNINLTIHEGERLGIVGSNGSGKTTLLKLITGIASPTSGTVKAHGKIVSLIDLEAGFHPDLSGLKNIYLNGMIVGMSNSEITQKLKQIIDFADIGKFIDAPIFTYSSGMKLRLGFSIAVNADPDILILDENMSVGDEDFKEKSFNKIKEFFRTRKTIITVSHFLPVLIQSCSRVIWIERGRIKEDGEPRKIVKNYLRSIQK